MTVPIDLSIVIPAYNEQDRIVPTLEHTIAYLAVQPFESQIVVVSDGSRDRTVEVASTFKTDSKVRLEILEYYPNRGKGYAVRHGMLYAHGRVIMFMDADYAVPIHFYQRGMQLLKEGCDIAIASRAVSGARVTTHQKYFRELSARLYTLIQNGYLGISFPDTQCGFKLFKREAAQRLFKRQRLHSVIFDPEILWLAKKEGFKVGQFPVEWRHIADSRIQYDSLQKSLFVFRELFRIRRLHRNE
jgi:dolichyl-phosphate beta-glucosyltransferase